MSTQRVIRQEVSAGEQAFEQENGAEEEPAFRPSVEQEIQTKVEANHPDSIV